MQYWTLRGSECSRSLTISDLARNYAQVFRGLLISVGTSGAGALSKFLGERLLQRALRLRHSRGQIVRRFVG